MAEDLLSNKEDIADTNPSPEQTGVCPVGIVKWWERGKPYLGRMAPGTGSGVGQAERQRHSGLHLGRSMMKTK